MNKKGVTLIELLVAMTLASVVFVIVGSILAMFVTQSTKSQRQEMFEQAKNDLVQELSNNIRWGKEIGVVGNVLTVDGNEYRLDDGKLEKNGESLVSEGVTITSFEIADRSNSPDLFGAEISIGMQATTYPLASDVMRLSVSQRITEISQ